MKTPMLLLSVSLLWAGQGMAQQRIAGQSEQASPSAAVSSDASKESTAPPATDQAASSDASKESATPPASDQAASSGATRTGTAADTKSGSTKSDMAALTTQEFVTEQQDNHVGSDELIGKGVLGPDGREIGGIDALILDENGYVVAAVVAVGGFLGIGDKPVALPWQGLTITNDVRGKQVIHAEVTKEQLESAPRFQSLAERRQSANRERARLPVQPPTESPTVPAESKPKTR